jgi:DNA primase
LDSVVRSKIPEDIAQQIRDRAADDIEAIIGEHVVLKKNGRQYSGLCPFHADKNPSLDVSNGMFICRSCGAGGDAIRFLQDFLGLSYPEVARSLAARFEISLPDTTTPEQRYEQQERDRLLEVVAAAALFYQEQLPVSLAAEYLDSRRVTAEVISTWRLGYSPSSTTTLQQHLINRGYEMDVIARAGLVVPTRDGSDWIDTFRGRLMIPIANQVGQIVGFGARALANEKAKYINSPETEIFKKNELLFGLNLARRAIKQADSVLVVEGYFDVFAGHSFGVSNIVATMGTALGKSQIRLLTRLTKSIVTGFDSDQAGVQATSRALSSLKELANSDLINLDVLTFPAKDLGEFFAGADDSSSLLDHKTPWFNWQFSQLVQGKDLGSPDVFRSVVSESVKVLREIRSPTTRTYYLRHCAQLLSQGKTSFAQQLESDLRSQIQSRSPTSQVQTVPDWRRQAESRLIWVYLHHPALRSRISHALVARELHWSIESHRKLWQQIEDLEFQDPDEDLLLSLRLTSASGLLEQLTPPKEDPMPSIESLIAALEDCRRTDQSRYLLSTWAKHRCDGSSPEVQQFFVTLLEQVYADRWIE